MSDSLGMSVGTTKLVATHAGRPAVTRRAVLTLFDHREPELGLPEENPNLTEPGLVLRGFVERVGDPVPLVASDGSAHRGEALAAEALDAMGRAVGYGVPVVIAVPAHWGPGPVGALRGALRAKPGLAPEGAPPALVSDAVAALAALYAAPGLPTDGVVALCDFGGNGTNITLADAAANFLPIGPTVRDQDFSGDKVDQGILNHLLANLHDGNADPASTAAVGSLTRLRTECRQAKERLSSEAATVVPVEIPGFSNVVRLNRTDLENVISGPLDQFLAFFLETLENNRIPLADLTAVATVGGGASIPAITERLSQRLGVPVITTPAPALSAAVGAAVLAGQRPPADTATNWAAAPDTPTSKAPSAWAAGAAVEAKKQSAADGAKSATFRALAWSQDDSAGDEPVPYSGADYASGYSQGATGAHPAAELEPANDRALEPEPLRWYKRPAVLFGLAAAFVLLAGGGLAYTLTATGGNPTDTSPPPVTVTVTGPNGSPTVSVITPPPSTTTGASTTANTSATTSTSQQSTTTTTSPPTTTQPPTTTTAEKTTKPPTTTAEPSTTAAEPVTPTS